MNSCQICTFDFDMGEHRPKMPCTQCPCTLCLDCLISLIQKGCPFCRNSFSCKRFEKFPDNKEILEQIKALGEKKQSRVLTRRQKHKLLFDDSKPIIVPSKGYEKESEIVFDHQALGSVLSESTSYSKFVGSEKKDIAITTKNNKKKVVVRGSNVNDNSVNFSGTLLFVDIGIQEESLLQKRRNPFGGDKDSQLRDQMSKKSFLSEITQRIKGNQESRGFF